MSKILTLATFLFCLCSTGAHAATAMGTTYEQAQTNCNIEMLGAGVLGQCSHSNGLFVCDCEQATTPGVTCNTAIGVGYNGAQSNCLIQSNGAGQVSNCSFNPNGTVLCSCCQ